MNNKGYFTIVDLLLGLVIMIMVITIAYSINLLIYKMNDFSYTQTFNTHDSGLILNYLTGEIRNVKAVTCTESVDDELQYTDKNGNSKSITYNDPDKAVEVRENGSLILTLGQGNIASISFQGTNFSESKIEIKVTIVFANGDSVVTNIMTMNIIT